MDELGIKKLTADNWLEADYVSYNLIRNNSGAKELVVTVSDLYVQSIAAIHLSMNTPLEVRRAFEVAKGAMIYGYFFYPLFTIGLEHLYKVAEIAVKAKCTKLEPMRKKESLTKGIQILISQGIIDHTIEKRWYPLRDLRNGASHPVSQTMVTPGIAIQMLKLFARDLEHMYQ